MNDKRVLQILESFGSALLEIEQVCSVIIDDQDARLVHARVELQIARNILCELMQEAATGG